jgi:DNA-binding response OmpR family regulator
VLVAEDDLDTRQLVAGVLGRAGHDVLEAADGEEALRLALERKPDVAIVDGAMPKLDGFEVVRRLRGAGARLPVILLTARTYEREVVEGLAAGADDYVPKPFSTDDLLQRVERVLGPR